MYVHSYSLFNFYTNFLSCKKIIAKIFSKFNAAYTIYLNEYHQRILDIACWE